MFELTGFQRDLLFVIASQSQPSGQDIKEELADDVGDVNHGRLYPNLDTLVERDYVRKGTIDRRTNCYELTDRGARLIAERATWQRERAGDLMESQSIPS